MNDTAKPIHDWDALAGLREGAIALSSRPLLAMPHMSAFLGGRETVPLRDASCAAAIAGWGGGWPAWRGARIANRLGLPFVRIEDGFLRSAGIGKNGAPPVGIIVDRNGIYFDARQSSDLEQLISTAAQSAGSNARALSAIELWRNHRLSKYNLPEGDGRMPGQVRAILADQVYGDASIAGSGADAHTFSRMLHQALERFGADNIALRAHPDVIAGKAKGYLASLPQAQALQWIAPDVPQQLVFDNAGEIWTVSSQLGFEGLIAGKKVTTFGMPFYAGWGLTQDSADGAIAEAARTRRSAKPSLEQLFSAAVLSYTRYADPVTKRSLTFEAAVERIVDWRERLVSRSRGVVLCLGFPRWKRRICEVFLGAPQRCLVLKSRASAASLQKLLPHVDMVAVWGAAQDPKMTGLVAANGKSLMHVEDGFLRSVGRGSDLRMPGSLVIDSAGMYYDATRPSELERFLESADISPEDVTRAARLRERIVQQGITKYNLGPAQATLRKIASGRRVLLVAAQVPNDAAIRLGTGNDVRSNEDLLRAVRRENPGAFVVYKNHPDLAAGNRRGGSSATALSRCADHIIDHGDIAGLFGQVDELHVMSSLAGFEALLRDVPVTVWGKPFYAGWGLTNDKLSIDRRTRRRTLDELIAAALIHYPAYADPLTGVPCSVEDYLDSLEELRARPRSKDRQGIFLQLSRLSRWFTGRIATGP